MIEAILRNKHLSFPADKFQLHRQPPDCIYNMLGVGL